MTRSTPCRAATRRKRPFALCGVLVAAAIGGLALAPALATPPSGFGPTPLSVGSFPSMDVKADKTGDWDLFLRTKDTSTVGVDRLDVASGGYSGWHTHTGPTFVTVVSGEITWYDGVACSRTVYRAGDGFVERANNPHYVRNESGLAAVILAVQMRPTGTGPRIDAPRPENCSLAP